MVDSSLGLPAHNPIFEVEREGYLLSTDRAIPKKIVSESPD